MSGGEQAPPLDDPRWMPLTYLHKWLSEHTTGDDYLAAAIMNAALASKPPMRCMRWDTVSRKHVPAAFWTDHEFYQDLMRWVVGPRNPTSGSRMPLSAGPRWSNQPTAPAMRSR